MQITRQHKIIIGILAVILAIFLIIKYNCEKIQQDVLEYGTGDKVEANYLINSRVRNSCLHIDVIGPISKGTPFYRSEINFYVKDKNGTTLGKSIIKDEEIFNSRGKHITFSTIIPNVTWKDRLCGIDLDMVLPYMYYSKNYVNNDRSNLKLYSKKYQKYERKRHSNKYDKKYFGCTDIETDDVVRMLRKIEGKGIKSDMELLKELESYEDGERLIPYVHIDEENKIYVTIDGKDIYLDNMGFYIFTAEELQKLGL